MLSVYSEFRLLNFQGKRTQSTRLRHQMEPFQRQHHSQRLRGLHHQALVHPGRRTGQRSQRIPHRTIWTQVGH